MRKKKLLKFPFRKETSSILGKIYRPVVKVKFWSRKEKNWLDIWMIVDLILYLLKNILFNLVSNSI